MYARCWIVSSIAAVLLSAGAGRAEEVKRIQKVYSVADLVIPMGEPPDGKSAAVQTTGCAASREKQAATPVGFSVTMHRPSATHEDDLIRTITHTIAPRSWSNRGGAGTIDYFPLTLSLVVNQTPDIQEQIADLLAALRRLQDMEVVVEVKFVEIPAEMMAGLQRRGILGDPSKEAHARGNVTFLNDAGVLRFLEAIQGDPHTSIMQAPRLTTFNGQKAAINITEEQFFVTGLEIVSREGHVIYQPKTESIPLGIQMALQPTISSDRRSVRLHLDLKRNELVPGEVPLFPITTPIEPREEGSPKTKPETFTQYIQQPRINKLNLDRTLAIPDGETAVLTGLMKQTGTVEATKSGVPILCDIPIIGDFFSTFECHPATHHVLVLVTPRICVEREK